MTVIDLRDRSGRGRAGHAARLPRPRSRPAPARPRTQPEQPALPGIAREVGWGLVGMDAASTTLAAGTAVAVLDAPLPAVAAVLLGWPVALCSSGAYSRRLGDGSGRWRSSVVRAGVRLLAALALVTGVVAGIAIQPAVATALLVVAATAATRWISARRLASAGSRSGSTTAIVRGSHADVGNLLRLLRDDQASPFRVIGVQYTLDPGPDAALPDGVAILPGTSDLTDAAPRLGADAVVLVGVQPEPPVTLRQMVWGLEEVNVAAHMVPVVAPLATPDVTSIGATGLPLLSFHTRDLGSEVGFGKVVLDKALAVLGIVALAPVLLVTALVVGTTSRGPVLFRQVRVGRGGREFRMLKFRTMYRDAEAMREELQSRNVHSCETLFKIKDDPRITPVGRVLRKYSLDELPQLFNVVRGEMSLVGPRPPLPEEVVNYAPEAHRRFRVRPGLTGLWQVSGRSDLDPVESTRLDTHYVEHWSAGMDLRILARTPRVVVSGEGAY